MWEKRRDQNRDVSLRGSNEGKENELNERKNKPKNRNTRNYITTPMKGKRFVVTNIQY